MKKIFLDTEFTGLTQDASLISLALVADTGEEFYAEFTDYNVEQLSDWVMTNVIANLFLSLTNQSRNLKRMYIKDNRFAIKSALEIWLHQFGIKKDNDQNIIPTLQIWADVPHYDWVLFCELFGGALHFSPQIHYMPMDLATMLYYKGLKYDENRENLVDKNKIPQGVKHNALYDALLGITVLKKYLKYD